MVLGMKLHRKFNKIAKRTSDWTGHPAAFGIALSLVFAWALTGPIFGYSNTWQLVINTGTTIVTFLMVFLIQNSQNRDTTALQIKLDELIRSNRGAKNSLLDLEDLDEEELSKIRDEYENLAARARRLSASKSTASKST